MQGWGSTCGVPIALAMVAQQALPEGAGLNNTLDQIFAHYGQVAHPEPAVGNAEWFYNGVRTAQITRGELKPTKVGSMQCHNAVEQFIKAGNTYSPAKVRQEWCGRLCAGQTYHAMKAINHYRNGTAFGPVALSTVPATCHTSACHTATQGRVIGKEDCLVCHK